MKPHRSDQRQSGHAIKSVRNAPIRAASVRPGIPSRDEPLTLDRLRDALVFAAYVVETYGEYYLPILDVLEQAYVEMQAKEAPRDRVRRILKTYTRDGGVKAIR